jgi:hypothetical protein
MKSAFRPRWLLIFAIAILSLTGIRVGANWLLPGAHQRLVQQYCEQISSLPEDKAARFVARLAEKHSEWAEVTIAAIADDRPMVASTAERELRSLVQRLARLPAEQGSPHVAELARALAAKAANLPPDHRSLAISLAHELIAWPIDGRIVDSAQFIAHCEAVLLLPATEPIEFRVAVAPLAPQKLSGPPPELELSPAEPSAESTLPSPPAVLTTDPTLPPAANTAPPTLAPSSPNEPQRFVPGRSVRISDD